MKAILNRELKTCPVFRNLKTLSLGEWRVAADFDSLVSFLPGAGPAIFWIPKFFGKKIFRYIVYMCICIGKKKTMKINKHPVRIRPTSRLLHSSPLPTWWPNGPLRLKKLYWQASLIHKKKTSLVSGQGLWDWEQRSNGHSSSSRSIAEFDCISFLIPLYDYIYIWYVFVLVCWTIRTFH